MKPCIWSRRRNQNEGTEWFRGGSDISYTKNSIPRDTEVDDMGRVGKPMYSNENNNNAFLYNNNGAGEGVESYFTFSFRYEFTPNQDDEVWFAHAIPHTYTEQQLKLLELKNNPDYADCLRMNILCLTLARNPVPLVTITDNISTYLDFNEEMRIWTKTPSVIKKAFRLKYSNARKLAKQIELAKGRV